MTSSSKPTTFESQTAPPENGGRFVMPLEEIDDAVWGVLRDLAPYLVSIEMLLTDAFAIYATDEPGSYIGTLDTIVDNLEHRFNHSVDPTVVGPYDFNELHDILHETTMTLIHNLQPYFDYALASINHEVGEEPSRWNIVRLNPVLVALDVRW